MDVDQVLLADPALIPQASMSWRREKTSAGRAEGLQDVRLGTCQRHLPILTVDLASGQVDTQRAENSRRRFLPALIAWIRASSSRGLKGLVT